MSVISHVILNDAVHGTEVRAGERVKCVYHCQVLGGRGSGKTSFVRGLIGNEQVGVA